MNNRKSQSSRARAANPSPASSTPSARRHHLTGQEPLSSRRGSSRPSHTPKAARVTTDVRVEQITNNTESSRNEPIDTGQPGDADRDPEPDQPGHVENSELMDTLTVPEVDADESSEASSMLSDPSDQAQSGDDQSIAVDCHTNPSEVIVKGKNVKQIRVKFPPHPPQSDDVPRKKSGRARLHRAQLGTSTRETTSPVCSNDEKLPYPFEETSLPAIAESGNNSAPVLHHQESCISLHSQDLPYNQVYPPTNRSLLGSGRPSNIDWNMKYKQDILAGLEYFEQRASDLNDLNTRASYELERLKLKNEELEELVYKLKKEKSCLLDEMDELKIKLDQNEKENCIIQNQAVSQWKDRVALEEKFIEFQRDQDLEIKSLKERISEKDKEIKIITSQKNMDLSPNVAGEMSTSNLREGKRSTALSEDHFDLLHTISRLQDDIRRHSRDKDTFAEVNNKLRQEAEDLKLSLKEKTHELESQSKRFMSLKKSFNDLFEEHEILKAQLRGRSLSQSHVHPVQREQNAANTTWPSSNGQHAKSGLTTVELESVSYIDLPKGGIRGNGNAAPFKPAAIGSQKLPKGNNGLGAKLSKSSSQKRTKSDVINLTDNLPPVPNPSR